MKLNKKIFVILVSLLFTFLCGCTQNTQFEPTEQPHLYWKDIDVVVENVDSRHWFASTHHYIVYVTVRSDEYQLTYTDEFAGSGAFGYPEQGNYRNGTGLKIAGWHLNGELEDFDNFFDSAVASMDGVTTTRTFQGKTYTELWEEFGDVPMNPETECIEVAWCGFPKGTHREDIWHWFEETFGVAVHDLMYS